MEIYLEYEKLYACFFSYLVRNKYNYKMPACY